MTALVPGRRQFDEVMMFIDPTSRRKTQSKTLDYKPGGWDAIKLGHASGVVNRVLNKFGLTELPMAQGSVKEVAKKRVSGETRERKALLREADVRAKAAKQTASTPKQTASTPKQTASTPK